MRRFKSAKQAQCFLSAFGPITGHFQLRRHHVHAEEYRTMVQDRFQQWNEVTGVKLVA
jgi:putative transposase